MPDGAPRPVLEAAVDGLRRVSESEVALFYAAEELDRDTIRAVDWVVAGTGRHARDVLDVFERGFQISSATARGSREWERRFLRFEELSRRLPAAAAKHREETADPTGVIDQLILQVASGGCFLGCVVALRFEGERPYDPRLPGMLRSLVAPLGGQVVTAQARIRSVYPEQACDLLVRADGRVEYASESAKRWLELPDVASDLRRVVAEVDSGRLDGRDVPFRSASARVVRMESNDAVRYVVHLAPPRGFPERSPLTEAERQIAELAVAGATAAEIAALRGTTEGTVRNQPKRIYARLEVATRIELARALGG